MVLGSLQETLHLSFLLLITRQNVVFAVLKKLMLPGRFERWLSRFTIWDVTTKLFMERLNSCRSQVLTLISHFTQSGSYVANWSVEFDQHWGLNKHDFSHFSVIIHYTHMKSKSVWQCLMIWLVFQISWVSIKLLIINDYSDFNLQFISDKCHGFCACIPTKYG